MGGLGPGIGGMEYVVIAVVALLVVGPERLPALLNKLGKMVAKARNMANEFRSSFDEMARQSELDELRKEVDALRRGQTNMMPLGADAEATFKSIGEELNRPLLDAPVAGHDEWPDTPPDEPEAPPAPTTAKARARRQTPAKAATADAPKPKKPPAPRKKAVDL